MLHSKLMARVVGIGLSMTILSTVTLAAAGTAYTGIAKNIPQQDGKVATLLVGGKVTRFDNSDAQYIADDNASVVYTDDVDSSSSRISSFSAGGQDSTDNDYAYHAGLYVDSTGVVDSKSVTDALGSGATYDATSAKNVTIDSTDPSFNGIIVAGGINYTISKASIKFETDGDGLQTCDFSGKGAGIAAYGEGTKLTIEDSDISMSGVANLSVFADSGSNVTIRNSKLNSQGGTLHAGYQNSPSQNSMVAPPWILGIMGNSRCTNLMGNNSTMSVIDSETSAAKWAILSTDSGSNMKLNVVNSTMDLTGSDVPIQADDTFKDSEGDPNPYTTRSGYGTYVIGSADEQFLGVTMNVGTYGAIFTGGTATYTNLEKGKTYDLKDANGDTTETYEATEDKPTTINSDTFGFMSHQGTDTITLENGTVVNSNYASLLIKNTQGDTTVNVSGDTELNNANGVLMQVMDNDDSTTGMNTATFSFNTTHTEDAGWPSENGNISSEMTTDTSSSAGGPGGGSTAASAVVNHLNVTDDELYGDVYNGSGYYGQTAVGVEVNLGKDAVYHGAVAQTETIHTDAINYTSKVRDEGTSAEDAGQITSFTIAEYYDIGHVANRYYNNGDNTLAVNLTDNAVWNVTGNCLLSSLSIADGATVQGEGGTVTMTVDGKDTDLAPGDYTGEIKLTYTPDSSEGSMAEASASTVEAPAASAAVTASAAPSAAASAAVSQTADETGSNGLNTGAIVAIIVAILAVGIIVVAVVMKGKKK